jgi:hypothetical protein
MVSVGLAALASELLAEAYRRRQLILTSHFFALRQRYTASRRRRLIRLCGRHSLLPGDGRWQAIAHGSGGHPAARYRTFGPGGGGPEMSPYSQNGCA